MPPDPDRPLPEPPYEGYAVASWGCNFIDASGPCRRRAHAHYLWADDSTSGACLVHAAQVERHYSYIDRHTMRTICHQPDAEWCHSAEDPPGRCEVPPLADDLGATTGRVLVGTVQA